VLPFTETCKRQVIGVHSNTQLSGRSEFPVAVGLFVDVNLFKMAVAVMLWAQVSKVPDIGVATGIEINLMVDFASGC
jgi:hypothetical protein